MAVSLADVVDIDSWCDGLILVNDQGLIQSVNGIASQILGWEEALVVGKSVHDLLCKHSVYTEHESLDCPLSKKSAPLLQPRESFWTTKNNENIAVSFRRIYDESGNTLIIFTSCERQGFQVEELRKLASFTDINPAPLLELDAQGLILFSNPAMTDLMLEYGFDDEGAPAILPDNLSDLVIKALDNGGLDNIESCAVSEEGELCCYLWQFHLNDGAQGKTILLSGIDVTSKKLMERQKQEYEQALEKEKEKTRKEYLAMMVHELRSPLNAVVGYANVLKLKLKGKISEAHLSLFDKIIDGGNQLAEQISTTLESTKLEAAKLEARISTFDAVPVLNKVCEELKAIAEQKMLELELSTSDQEVMLVADSQHFRQIAINLISNAIKYTVRGKVSVSLDAIEAIDLGFGVRLSVKDTGCGIPDAQKESIFRLYERQAGHESSDIEGDGYGLAIVGEMVELNRGKLELESRVGVGSTFTVLFPV